MLKNYEINSFFLLKLYSFFQFSIDYMERTIYNSIYVTINEGGKY